jgi:hypothetical protein
MSEIQPAYPEVVQAVQRILEEKEIYLDYTTVEAIVSAHGHWLTNTRRGCEFIAHALSLDHLPGKNEQVYRKLDGFGREGKEIDPRSIIFLRGCLVNGEAYPVSQIQIKEREVERCESCGGTSVCAKVVKTAHGVERLSTMCSHCASAHEDLTIRDQFKFSCNDCSYTKCSWHPVNIDCPPFEQRFSMLA